MSDELDDDHPLWCVNSQIEGLLEGIGATEDHEDVLAFLRSTGLPEGTVRRMHHAIVFGDSKVPWSAGVRDLMVAIEYMRFECEHSAGKTPADQRRLTSAISVGIRANAKAAVIIGDYQSDAFWKEVRALARTAALPAAPTVWRAGEPSTGHFV